MPLDSLQVATGPLADLGFCEEASYGKVPASPTVKVCRRRSTTLGLTKEEYSSEEVRADRMVSDSRHGIRRVNGDVVTEISPGAHADLYQALLGGVWGAVPAINVATGQSPVTITDLGNGTLQFAGPSFTTSDFLIGDTLSFDSTTVAALDGKVFTLVGIDGSNNGIAMPWGGFFAAATLPITTTVGTLGISGKRCAMGNIARSFTFERAYTDIGKFGVFTGVRVNSAAIDLPATGIATCTLGLMGRDARPLASVSIDGSAAVVGDAADFTSLTFNASAKTITAAAGSFITKGFSVGDKVIFDGSGVTDAQNRNPKTITALTATAMTVAEAIQSGGPYTTPFTVTKVGATAWNAAQSNQVLVAASGVLVIGGAPAATVTSLSFNVDNQMAGAPVVGANTVPIQSWGNQCLVTGQMTLLFDRGGLGETVYNAFDLETETTVVMRLDSSDGSKAITFAFPRVKINAGTIGDAAAEGLPVSVDFRALKPAGGKLGASQIVILDSAA